MPFAGYADWNDCISKNADKNDKSAYCGSIKHKVEDTVTELDFSKGFDIMEPAIIQEQTQGKKRAFTHSSSFVGNVRYNPQNQTMRVMMNGKGYGFCGVPERVFDSWEGANSKGEYWWRNIKDRYNCSSLQESIDKREQQLRAMGIPDDEINRTMNNEFDTHDTIHPWPPAIENEDKLPTPDMLQIPNTVYPPFVAPDSLMFSGYGFTTTETAEWDESKHPRDEQGKFTSGGENTVKPRDSLENDIEDSIANDEGEQLNRVVQSYRFSQDGSGGNLDSLTSMFLPSGNPELAKLAPDLQDKNKRASAVQKAKQHMTDSQYQSFTAQIAHEDKINQELQDTFDRTEFLYRGVSDEELESFQKTGKLGKEQGLFDFVFATQNPFKALQFGSNVIKIDKNALGNDAQPLFYTAFGNSHDFDKGVYSNKETEFSHHSVAIKTGSSTNAISAIYSDKKPTVTELAIPNSLSGVAIGGKKKDDEQIAITGAELFPEDISAAQSLGSKTGANPSMHGLEGWASHRKIPEFQRDYEEPRGPRFNEAIRETVSQLQHEFKWMSPEYVEKAKTIPIQNGGQGRVLLIRAAAETVTDHRAEAPPGTPESQYLRKLGGDELHSMARTGITKGSDINHLGKQFQTNGVVLDADYDVGRKEMQLVHYETDPEILNAITNGTIGAVSINGGLPRRTSVQCDDQCYVVPEGVILGENDNIAFTYVVTDPRGMMWRGQIIPPAKPGIAVTALEFLE